MYHYMEKMVVAPNVASSKFNVIFFFSHDSRVSWVDGSGVGFSLDYPSISLHAISRDLSAYPAEHLYVQVNSKHQGMNAD